MNTPRTSFKYVFLALGIILVLLLAVVFGSLFFISNLAKQQLNKTPTYSAQDLSKKASELIDKGDYTSAESYLEKALLKEDDSTYRNSLAVVKYRLKKYDEAITQYQKLIDQKKDVAFSWNGIGNAYRDWASEKPEMKADYEQKALGAYSQSIAADTLYVAAYSNKALLLRSENKTAEAIQILNQGITATGQSALITLKTQLEKEI